MIFRPAPPFTHQHIAPVADLITYGEYLMGVVRLLGRSSTIPVPSLIFASLMAHEAADHAHEDDPHKVFYEAWRGFMLASFEPFITSSEPERGGEPGGA